MIRIATWNINSVRLRAGLVTRLLREQQPDVLCLQETKCPNDHFPTAAFRELGYDHIAHHGQAGYHGVAVISRLPFAASSSRPFCDRGDARHVCVTLDAGRPLTVHSLYVPSGGDVPDPAINDKFAHKLAFLDELDAWVGAGRGAADHAHVLTGDLNIAPLETDVWSHRQLLSVVSHTPAETERLTGILERGGWTDAVRQHVPPSQRLYTWWSYRNRDWSLSDRGRRLDHIWVSPPLGQACRTAWVLREARGWPQPSDHVPVLVDLEL